jgi:hypothetical protein
MHLFVQIESARGPARLLEIVSSNAAKEGSESHEQDPFDDIGALLLCFMGAFV